MDVPWLCRKGLPIEHPFPFYCGHCALAASLGSQLRLNCPCDHYGTGTGELGRDPWGREVMGTEQEAFPPLLGSGVGKSCYKTLGGSSLLAKPLGLLCLCRHPAGSVVW